jgi:hypothetical protein
LCPPRDHLLDAAWATGKYWSLALPKGHLYFTVELADQRAIRAAFAEGQHLGLPVVHGEAEWLDDGGYHYYPEMEQVRAWVAQAGFDVIDEQADEEYHHYVVQK